ncbi:hypothetical protein SAMN04489835_5755 [Mycolicibacterium rutilum]|uniref:Uncharacterized protein n=1 Tax=Mycolicibacterium rutilum TaxID=370526 RepID=A0A1H6M4B0_MYCRU|nr:hypothetical protein [Mycolicibacterium rutilum]SEH92373.1 hypothetical protein SAMN04489835_5755 [Mycolicibacterium rutilum]
MPTHNRTAATILWGIAAGAAVALAPAAAAQDPPPAEPTQQQQPPVDPAGVATSAIDGAIENLPPASPYPTSGPPGGVCMRMNGFPIYVPPGGLPSELVASGVPSGPVHAGNCTSEDGPVGAAADVATDVVDSAIPPAQSSTPPPPPPP